MDERRSPGCLKGTLVIFLVMMLCVVVTTVGIDGMCVADMGPHLPVYPNATIQQEQHNFLRQFGMGESLTILHSDETAEIVRDWYARTVGALEYAEVQKGTMKHLGRTRWTVSESADGKGSQIVLYGYCGN